MTKRPSPRSVAITIAYALAVAALFFPGLWHTFTRPTPPDLGKCLAWDEEIATFRKPHLNREDSIREACTLWEKNPSAEAKEK